ncbi:MAG: hypothetical protein JWQ35_113 [Bacteriovoracaceae bacterium]|nr:hypothetical protein [Bacteriovoracaceae bacterium]
MIQFLLKVVLSAVIIATIAEIGKRSSILAALFASLPLSTCLAVIWIYIDTGDKEKVANLSMNIFWILQPSFIFLLLLPLLLRCGYSFLSSFTLSLVAMVIGYAGYFSLLKRLKILN